MLAGIAIMDIKLNADERGIFSEVFRKDWQEFFDSEVVQTNLSISYPGVIRAWHRHSRGQIDYFLVIQGVIKLCAYDDDSRSLTEIICNEKKLQVVRMPGKYWHGFKNIGNKEAIVIYFTNKLYDHLDPDEERRAWNDPKIIDNNGSSFDWNKLPHK